MANKKLTITAFFRGSLTKEEVDIIIKAWHKTLDEFCGCEDDHTNCPFLFAVSDGRTVSSFQYRQALSDFKARKNSNKELVS